MPTGLRTGMILVTLLFASSVTLLGFVQGHAPALADAGNSPVAESPIQETRPTATPQRPDLTLPAAEISDAPAPTATPTPKSAPSAGQDLVDPQFRPTTPRPIPTDSKPAVEIPAAQPARLASFAPASIQIPAIDVSARVIHVGVNESGAMDTPSDYEEVAWYQHGAIPGDPGRAVLAGHVDSLTGPAVFYRLRHLQPGDEISIELGAGTHARFVVRETASYRTDLAPVDQIFGDSDTAELVLITCGGPFDRAARQYLERVVVYAELVVEEASTTN